MLCFFLLGVPQKACKGANIGIGSDQEQKMIIFAFFFFYNPTGNPVIMISKCSKNGMLCFFLLGVQQKACIGADIGNGMPFYDVHDGF